jgi:hypothetical protein
MKSHIKILFLTIVAGILNVQTGVSQDCAVKLQEAQLLFDRGQVELVAGSLMPCLEAGNFSKEDELSAYKLLIHSLLLDEKIDMAEEAMLSFLKRNPEYEHTAADYSGFIYLKNRFQVRPVLMLSVKAGLNYSILSVPSSNSLSPLEPDISYAREPFNIYAGTEILLPVADRLNVSAGLFYSSSSFLYTENMMNFGTVSYREGQSRLEVPITALYDLKRMGSVTLYGRLGGGLALNLNTDSKPAFNPTDINNAINRTGENENRSGSRIRSDLFVQAGLGGTLKVPHGYLSAEIRTIFGTRNQLVNSNPGNLEYHYFYSDDNFRVNIAGISLGYTHIFYKPSKKQDL